MRRKGTTVLAQQAQAAAGGGSSFENANSASFDGSASFINCGNLPMATKMTIGGWFKPSSFINGRSLMSKWEASDNERSIEFEMNSAGALRILISVDGTNIVKNWVTNTNILSTSAWKFVGWSIDADGGTLNAFIDTIFETSYTKTTDSSMSGGPYSSAANFCLGAVSKGAGGTTAAFYPGLMTHCFVASGVAFTEAQWQAAKSGTAPADLSGHSQYSSIIAWWQLMNLTDTTSTLKNYKNIGTYDGTGTSITLSTDNP